MEREVEDLEALIDAAGGSAYLFGSSSGSVLALEAASQLGDQVKGLFMYEPPFIVDDSRPPMPEDFSARSQRARGGRPPQRGGQALLHRRHGHSAACVTLMRLLMPGWSGMAGMAHTIPVRPGGPRGHTGRKAVAGRTLGFDQAPTLVMVGGRSEPFFHTGAKALASLLPECPVSCARRPRPFGHPDGSQGSCAAAVHRILSGG